MKTVVSPDAAVEAAARIARELDAAVRTRGSGSLAVSGGSTAPQMLAALVGHDLPWQRLTVHQVDERIAPDGDPARNSNQLRVFDDLPIAVRPMPVTAPDLEEAARRYGADLPPVLDVVHLGVGEDGHTASWPPGIALPIESERDVEVVPAFNGWSRMTLTVRAVNRARMRVVLATGCAKADALAGWRSGDPALPVVHLRTEATVLVVDADASIGLAE